MTDDQSANADLKDAAVIVAGRLQAMEFAIFILLKMHPEPEKLAQEWRDKVLNLIDAAMSAQLYTGSKPFRDGLNDQLVRFASLLPNDRRAAH